MGSTQRFMKFFLGLLFSRSGVKQKKPGYSKVNIRIKKDLMKHGECVLHKVLISYFFLGSQTMPKFALLTDLEDAEISQKQLYYAYFAGAAERRVTSWAPPSTIEVAETRVSLASRCRSGMLITPQLHMVDLTLYREASTLSCREPA